MTALLSRVEAEPIPTSERFTHPICLPGPQPLYGRATLGTAAPCEQAQ